MYILQVNIKENSGVKREIGGIAIKSIYKL